jgi:hypothetical protein
MTTNDSRDPIKRDTDVHEDYTEVSQIQRPVSIV